MKYESAVENSATRTLIKSDAHSQNAITAEMPVGKRILDLLIAVPALFVLSPFMLIVGLLIKLQDGGPTFFIHERRGENGMPFLCMKFRTMRTDAEAVLAHILATNPDMAAEWEANQKFRRDPRITAFGHFLRKTSLDELPQLLNIIRGEMSVVGPRPIVEDEVKRYGEYIAQYDAMRPGVTGLWQVSGRSETTYDERVQMDVQYFENMSVQEDLRILFLTIPAVLSSRGAC
ncbi:MAG: sugar transferase [Pseudomonadota bacterium]